MIFNVKNTAGMGRRVKVFAYAGLEIRAVTKYNTRTREVEFFVLGYTANGTTRALTEPTGDKLFPRKVVKMKLKLPGSFIVVDGKKY
jgi:hypothetical protein